jgi:type II secretory ATPase GspE/PulE/Tfp pilus assembly ATPase PilB-like protein
MPELSSLHNPTFASLLAALPTEGGYFSPFRIVVFTLAVVLWAYCSTWVDSDTKTVRMPQGLWSALTFSAGLVAVLLWMLLPNFWIGLLVYSVLYGSMLVTYIVLRNKRVGPTQTVLTLAHVQRLTKGGSGTETKVKDSQDRTRIKDANGKSPPWPTDPEQHAGYQALQDLLFDAIWRRTSDVRIDLTPNDPVKVIYRVDGVDRAREPIDAPLGPLIFAHMKKIAGLNPEEHRRPQRGQFKAAIGAGGKGDRSVQVDVSTSGSTAGERILLRLLSEEGKFRLPDIGLTKEQLAAMQKIVAEPKGVLLVSGPKQSGVTSTLYAALRQHDAFIQNIHTLEVFKNMDVENITQNVFDSLGGTVTFGKRFRTVLRTEPDIIMAGELPDAETAQLAAGAGKQGKKLYIGMTSKDTFHALRQYLQAVNDNPLAGGSLLGVTSQRLVRLLCTNCRRAYKPDPALLKKGNLPTGENRPFYRPPNPNEVEVDKRGEPVICQICQGSGYLGRTGVFETLILDDELRNMIIKGEELALVKAAARKRGMLYLQEVALYKVYEGLTSINEVLRVTKEAAPAAATA